MQIVKCYLLASTLLFLVGSVPALAVPVTWTLSGVTFNDGGVATGRVTSLKSALRAPPKVAGSSAAL